MNYFFAILTGAIQGITEFLPISSSGHLVIFHDMFGFNLPDNVLFDVVLHLGSLVAVLLVFYKDIMKIIRGFFSSLLNFNLSNNFNQRLAWMVIIGTIPAGILGYTFDRFITDTLHNNPIAPLVVAFMLILVAILFWVAERYSIQRKELKEMNKMDAFILGCAQAVALIPGTSRSGITIIAGLWKNLKRSEAARFSFLLSVPVILGAGLKSIMNVNDWHQVPVMMLILGFLSAAITGYFAIKFLMKFLSNHSLNVFAWYRLVMGLLIIGWFLLFRGL